MKIKTTGLILGKFAPFHDGHQYLIETALSEVDKVLIIVYDCPNLTNIPLNVRAEWVRKLYPQVEVIEGWDAPNQHEDTPEVKRLQENYIGKVLGGRKITHFISSEYYGEHMSKYLNAVNRVVDIDRNKHKISGTMIRKDLNTHKHKIHPVVLKDLLTKVVLLGFPSNLNERIVYKVAKELYTTYISDNLLPVINKHNLYDNKQKINFSKVGKEKYDLRNNTSVYCQANRSLIYNSSILIDHILSIAINRKYDKMLFKLARAEMNGYDLVFISNSSVGQINEFYGIDYNFFMNQLMGNLNSMKIEYTVLSGSQNDKIKKMKNDIKLHLKNNKY